jgi:hypothetical protein
MPVPPGAAGRPEAGLQDPAADELHEALWWFFDRRRTLTTRHHVLGPGYVPIKISADLGLRRDAPPDEALAAAHEALKIYFDPLTGGSDGKGWPFGRAAYASEASAVLQALPLLRYVENVQVTAPGDTGSEQADDQGEPAAVTLDAGELVLLEAIDLTPYHAVGT